MLRPASSRTWALTGRGVPAAPRSLRLDAFGNAAGGCCGAVLRVLHAPASAQRAACADGAAKAGIAAPEARPARYSDSAALRGRARCNAVQQFTGVDGRR